jgi:hypothetical protein
MRSIKKIMSVVLLLAALCAVGQAPSGFNYQGVARGTDGQQLGDQDISIQIQLRKGGANGTIVYTETHSIVTNAYGLFNVIVGQGISGSNFSSVDWGGGDIWIQTDVDFEGGTNYVFLNAVQLLSVPYALYAENIGGLWEQNGDTLSHMGPRVGIGTTSPDSRLTLEAETDSFLEGNLLSFRNIDTSPRSSVGLQMSASNNTETFGSLNYYGGTFANTVEFTNTFAMHTNGDGLIFNNWREGATTKFFFKNGGLEYQEAMRITSDLRVGILSDNPLSPLEVGGVIHSTIGGYKFPDGSVQSTMAMTSWSVNGADVYHDSGSVGIGTNTPSSKLQISDGDVYIDNATNGVIMTSPNGSCFRMTVSDAGTPVFSPIVCP